MKNISGTVNWGIIGCGDVCEVKSGPAFNKVANSKLVAVMRRNLDKVKDFAHRHGVPKYYTDAAELTNDLEVNAIYIATPPSSHESYLEMALKAGKPVYVEKPVTINSASVERMMAMERQYEVKASVAHYRRGLPLFNKIKQLVNDCTIGKVKLILLRTLQPPVSKIITQTDDNWRINPEISGGGLFHDLSPHQLDIMYWIFGIPQQVFVQTANQGKLYNAPDLTMVQLAFANDIYFSGVWDFNVAETATTDSCEIIGDKGSIRFSFFRVSTIELITGAGTEILELEYPVNIQQPHINNVVKFFRGEGANPCTLEDAFVTMRVMDKAVQ
ncbi:MAG TPA: Gfo/Idh/MocA family oxidoreductase [Chitinophagaceae bacterium]|jgi:predicted dehydrogenase|nr:Gfo/Idh/MocA family oxidoreductase [Chitinophagaceae bacterium]